MIKILLFQLTIVIELSKISCFSGLIYDPCGYVGSSSNPNLPDTCLTTSDDCCYFAWKISGYVYYSCISKIKLYNNWGYNNMTFAFVNGINNPQYFETLDRLMYSKCANNTDIIESPSNQKAPYVGPFRNLAQNEDQIFDITNEEGLTIKEIYDSNIDNYKFELYNLYLVIKQYIYYYIYYYN